MNDPAEAVSDGPNRQLNKDADAALNTAHELAPGNVKTLYALAHTELDEQMMGEAEAHRVLIWQSSQTMRPPWLTTIPMCFNRTDKQEQ